MRVAGALGADVSAPHCARVQPARLVGGLADAVERLGVAIFEGTAVHRDRAASGADRPTARVRAPDASWLTEGYTAGLPRAAAQMAADELGP